MEKSIKKQEKESFNLLNLFKRTDKKDSEILSALNKIARKDFDSDFSSLFSTVNKHKSFFEKIDITPEDLYKIDDYADGATFDTPESWAISDYRANFIENNYDKDIKNQLNENERHYLSSFLSTLNYINKYDDLTNTLSNIATNFIATGYKPSQVNDKILSSLNLSNNDPVNEQEPLKENPIASPTPDDKRHLTQTSLYKGDVPETIDNSNHPLTNGENLKAQQENQIISQLGTLGVNIGEMKKNGTLDELLSGRKTSQLISAYTKVGNTKVEFQTKLTACIDNEGKASISIHPKRDLETILSNGFKGHLFTEEEKGNLMALCSVGHTITINNENYLVGTDSLTNELIARKQQDVKIPDEFGGQKLPDKKREILANGKPVFLEQIKKGDMECSGLVQYSVEKGRLELLQYGLNISAIQNIKLPKEQQELLQEGKTVLVSGLFDSEGVKYNAWVRLDMKNRTLMQTKDIPNKVMLSQKEIIPHNEHRTQVNQNTKGIKTEVNKFSTKPINSGKQKVENTSGQKRHKGIKHN